MPHFGRYRKDGKYEGYHAAAAAVVAGTASEEQQELALGLDQEMPQAQ